MLLYGASPEIISCKVFKVLNDLKDFKEKEQSYSGQEYA